MPKRDSRYHRRGQGKFQRKRAISPGFTLLELLISLTITGITLVLIFSSMRVTAGAWEKGEKEIDTNQQRRIVLDLLKTQISSICQVNALKARSGEISFRGDASSLFFKSSISLSPRNAFGDVYVAYQVIPLSDQVEQLVFYERTEADGVAAPKAGEAFPEPTGVLVPACYRVSFSYFIGINERGDFLWQDKWNMDNRDSGLPVAVQITLQDKPDDPAVSVIARIMVDAPRNPNIEDE